jgi:hypothetical protein
MVHSTTAGERIKALKAEVRQAEQEIKAARRLARAGRDVKALQEDLENFRDNAQAEAMALKDKARLEDLRVYQVEKTTKKGSRCLYWHASWRVGQKVKNVYLGNCSKLDAEAARETARTLKAQDLSASL